MFTLWNVIRLKVNTCENGKTFDIITDAVKKVALVIVDDSELTTLILDSKNNLVFLVIILFIKILSLTYIEFKL